MGKIVHVPKTKCKICNLEILDRNFNRHLKSKTHQTKDKMITESSDESDISSDTHYEELEELEDYEEGRLAHIHELKMAIEKLKFQKVLVKQLKYIVFHW